jgi:hypothetical protein
MAPLDLPPPKQGCCSAGGGLVAYAKALCQMSKCGEGEELVFIRGLYDVGPLRPTPAQAGMLLRRGWFGRLREGFVPNVEMCELEKEMDKDESVVFRVGWTTR